MNPVEQQYGYIKSENERIGKGGCGWPTCPAQSTVRLIDPAGNGFRYCRSHADDLIGDGRNGWTVKEIGPS